jgi:hypothetical protein
MRTQIRKLTSLAAALLLIPAAANAIGEQNGKIAGRVTIEDTQNPAAGAQVTATSPMLVGGPRTVTANAQGHYEFFELPAGVYQISVEYAGTEPIKRQAVVQQARTTTVNVAWTAVAEMETQTVSTGTPGLTKPDSAQSGAVLSAASQSKIASGRSYQAVAQQVAGVTGGANPNVKGGNELMNRYLVDGLDITDPVTNTFSANINFDSIGSVEVLTGGMEAQYNSLGSVVNLVSTPGSMEFHADASVYANHYKLSFPNQFGQNLYEGYKPFDSTERPPTQGYQGNLNLSGPLFRNKLFGSLSLEYRRGEASVPAGPPLNRQAPNRVSNVYLGRAKLVFAPTQSHRITLSMMADPATFDYGDFDSSDANLFHPLAALRQDQGGYLGTVIWDWYWDDSLTFRLQAGGQENTLVVGPQGKLGDVDSKYGTYDYNRPAHNNDDDGTWWYNYPFDVDDARHTIQVDPSVTKRFELMGRHEAKAGIQTRWVRHKITVKRPGGGFYVDSGGGPLDTGLCDETTGNGCFLRIDAPNITETESGYSIGTFLQDRWKLNTLLTVVPGIRFDWGTSKDDLGRRVATLWGIGPRLGAIVDITQDQKNIFSLNYGRSNEVLSLLPAANASPGAVETIYLWDGTQFQQVATSGGPGSTLVDNKKHTPQHSDEIVASFRRELGKNNYGTIEYTWKQISNIWERVETNIIWDPSGTRVAGYVNGDPKAIFLLTRPDDNWIRYQGIDFIVEGAPSEAFDYYLSYTLSFKHGPGNEQLDQLGDVASQHFNNRQRMFYTGYAFGDIRHQIKLHGAYTFKGFTLGPNMTYQSGAVRAARFQTGRQADGSDYDILRTPIGTTPGRPNDPEDIREMRTPDLLVLGLRATYEIDVKVGQVDVIGDVFNALNLYSPTQISQIQRGNGIFGQATSRQQPLRVQLGLRYTY